jgi:hypothetical protein
MHKISFFFLAISFLLASNAQAQKKNERTEDVLYLKNGSVLRGKIVESSNDSIIRIETIGRNIFAHRLDEIDKVLREEKTKTDEYYQYNISARNQRDRYDMSLVKGTFYHHTNMKMSAGFNQSQPVGVIGVSHSSGYYLKSWFGLGLGLGIERNSQHTIMPTTLNIRGFINNTPNTLYYTVDVGYNVAFINQETNNDWQWRTMTDAQGGIYVHPAIGFRFYSATRAHFTLDFGYVFQQVNYSYRDNWNDSVEYTERNTWLRPALRLGVLF